MAVFPLGAPAVLWLGLTLNRGSLYLKKGFLGRILQVCLRAILTLPRDGVAAADRITNGVYGYGCNYISSRQADT